MCTRAFARNADDTAIIGTNSSTLASSLLENAVTHPERSLNTHFFNPALLMALVEVVPGPHTAEEPVEMLRELVAQGRLGKKTGGGFFSDPPR
jgi:3-hydroxybutyryl-CoA dehydrogenase